MIEFPQKCGISPVVYLISLLKCGIIKVCMTESDNPGRVFSFGDESDDTIAAKLKGKADTDPASDAARLLQTVNKALIEELGDRLQGIGMRWNDVTFNNLQNKAAVLPDIMLEWTSLKGLESLESETRLSLLNKFTQKGLKVVEGKETRAQRRYVAPLLRLGFTRRLRPVETFLDGVDPNIRFSAASYITLAAILELSNYPNNPHLDSLQIYLAQEEVRKQLIGPKGYVELPRVLEALNKWIPTIVELQSL